MALLTKDVLAQLLANGRRQDPVRGTDQEIDFIPVVKLFNPCGIGTWLLTEVEAEDPTIAFGLCDLGYPELGYVSLTELEELRLPLGLKIEQDRFFKACKPLSAYADDARVQGCIAA